MGPSCKVPLLDQIFFRKFRSMVGGRLRYVLVGTLSSSQISISLLQKK